MLLHLNALLPDDQWPIEELLDPTGRLVGREVEGYTRFDSQLASELLGRWREWEPNDANDNEQA